MSKKLNVYLNNKQVGELEQNQHGEMVFAYVPTWLERSGSFAISCSLPLRTEKFTQRECRPFFSGVLPEDSARRLIAKNLGISATNDFSMLEKIGGECAGAVKFLKPDVTFDRQSNEYRSMNSQQVLALLKKLPYQPLLAGEEGIRLSMAGVQDKIPVRIDKKQLFIPLEDSASTHILKTDNPHFDGLLYNEAFCMTLAKKSGLLVANVEITNTDNVEYLLIERYDRVIEGNSIYRLHQEDFCQALGVFPERKYQNEKGPSFKDCFSLIRRVSALPVIDLESLFESLVFNFLIGNCDAHGKNFSLLYKDGQIRLSPLYDLVCTLYYDSISTNMAMKIGGEYDATKINLPQFEKLSTLIGFTSAGVRKTIFTVTEKVLAAMTTMPLNHPIEVDIANIIQRRCALFIK